MKVMTVAEALTDFEKVLEGLVDGSVVLTRDERSVAAVDHEKLRRLVWARGRQAESRGRTEETLAELFAMTSESSESNDVVLTLLREVSAGA
jgi:hypothetical protein